MSTEVLHKMKTRIIRPWLQTLDDRKFDLLTPSSRDVSIKVIATVLSRIPRFGGHTKEFYSVAQHSVLVANLVHDSMAPYALLHDAHEAYTGFGDVCAPAKQLSPGIKAVERRVQEAIADRFGLCHERFYMEVIRDADVKALATESRDLLGPPPIPWTDLPEPCDFKIRPCGMEEAKALFLKEAERLGLTTRK